MSQNPTSLFDVKSAPVGVGGPLVVWKAALTPKEVDAIIAYGDGLKPMKAELAGRKDNIDHLRLTRVAWMLRNPEIAWLHARLEEMVLQINAQFYRYDLYGLNEPFQYTVYEGAEGGYYGWHVDMGEKNYEPRKISLSLQLSEPCGYQGGDLELEVGDGPYKAEKARGTLIAFPSYVLHRVSPVTSGIRKSLVIWVAGPEFR
jgi:PKHD-type hydroxylase